MNIYQKKKIEYIMAKQILRCGTSIGANIEEACGEQSKNDFISKLSISYKEARETNYWLRLLKDSNIIEIKIANSFMTDIDELLRILAKSLITAKSRK
jgi:four helix bundle protein